MKIGFVINQYATEAPAYTTTRLALQAHQMGHEVHYIAVEDFSYTQADQMGAHAKKVPDKKYRSPKIFLEATFAGPNKLLEADQLDVLMLRNDPSADLEDRPWAQYAGIVFGQLAKSNGLLVLNNPDSLASASNKMYFQYFPESVRPSTIITRSALEIKNFYNNHQKKVILKPLQGSGGKNVFMVNEDDKNLNQIIDAIGRDGYIIAQEYLPKASGGDIRLFLLNGRPIKIKGKIAAIRRSQAAHDIRSNIHQGASVSVPRITRKTLEIAEAVGPKLVKDGMFLVGLDIVGDKLMEINVFSPGGLGHASHLQKVNYFESVIQAVEENLTGSSRKASD
ncbi:glutathione synthetase [Niabella terrae]